MSLVIRFVPFLLALIKLIESASETSINSTETAIMETDSTKTTTMDSFVTENESHFCAEPATQNMLTDLRTLTQEELCDAICNTPTRPHFYFQYETDMLVLRQVLRDLHVQKYTLESMTRDKTYTTQRGRAAFKQVCTAFRESTYASSGVNAQFLLNFSHWAEVHGQESAAIMKTQLKSAAREVINLGERWVYECKRWSEASQISKERVSQESSILQ